jgi:hypothetical protein
MKQDAPRDEVDEVDALSVLKKESYPPSPSRFQNFDDKLDKQTRNIYEGVNLEAYQFSKRKVTTNGSRDALRNNENETPQVKKQKGVPAKRTSVSTINKNKKHKSQSCAMN